MARTRKTRSPKYAALAEKLRSQIKAGVLQPGDRLPTFVEMRAQHKVTPTTITKVYSLLQQEGLIICERGRGSFVAPPRKAATGVLGVLGMATPPHPYSMELMRGFLGATSRNGMELLFMDENLPRDWERVDGVILHGSDAPTVLRRLPPQMPSVIVMASVPDAVCVTADEYAGVCALVEHLLSLEHRRIAAMLDPLSPRRLSGYRAVLHDADLSPNPAWMRCIHHELAQESARGSYVELAYDAMRQWLREDWDDLNCTAIVTQNDDAANGVIEALRQAGKRVPEEVSVTGFDGAEVGNYLRPALTTVKVPLEEIGLSAVELLQKQIAGEQLRASTWMLPVSLITRDSTALRRSEDAKLRS